MKKIGLVTVTYVNNFGSHLQSFALQQVIKSLGYEPEIISAKGVSGDISKRRMKYLLTRIFDISELRSYYTTLKIKIAPFIDKEFGRILANRAGVFNQFAKNAFEISPVSNSWAEMTKMCKSRYSTVIIGSDQNWRPANIAGGYYTIEYVPDEINKAAYSTSFGISRIIPAQRKKAKFFLGRINHLSVREDTGQKIIKELIGRDVPVVCDPTLLLKKEEWESYIEQKSQVDLRKETATPYILCYFLGESQQNREFALKLKQKTGYRIVSVLYGEERYYKEDPKYYDLGLSAMGPLDFVNLISKAQYVCTDSFHGCAFSLVFEKQFYAFYKSAQGSKMSVNSRLDSMLGWAGVTNRIIKGDIELTDSLLSPIDYKKVRKKLEDKRKMSITFLKNSLI